MGETSIRRVCVGMLGTNCYIVSDPERDDCVVIDPGAEPERIRRAMDGKKLAAILLTHGHFDHIGAVDALMGSDTVLVIHEADAAMPGDTTLNVSWMIGETVTAQKPTRTVREGDDLTLAGLTFTVLHTPGHTPGCACYACGDVLFTGDTVMGAGCGRTDLPGGDDEAMSRSLARLAPLRARYTMLGGHG